MSNCLESDGAQLTKKYTLIRLFMRPTGELLVWPDSKGFLLRRYPATREIETLQIAIDAAVRAASQVPAMSERMLRLPLPLLDWECLTFVRRWPLREWHLGFASKMVTPLQPQCCNVRCKEFVDSHSVVVIRKGENVIPLVLCAP